MATLQALDRIDSETTIDVVARLLPTPAATAETKAPSRPTLRCVWVIDSRSGRPVCSWVVG
jgi:hypothetical protein